MAIANHFYNETTRRYVALFGTLFNQLKIKRKDNAGESTQDMIVPLSYAPFQKVLSRLNNDPDLLNSRQTAIRLPRMSFEITSLNYDPARKIGSTQKMRKDAKSESDSSRNFLYSAVPYNLDFSLYIMTKYSEDATQIMEQILPFFTPDWTVTAKMIPDLDPIDIPIILSGVTTEDIYEGDFETRQSILYTLTFTLKGYYFGPERKQKVIKFIDIDMNSSVKSDATPEERITIRPGMDAQGNPLTSDGIAATATSELTNGAVSAISVIDNGQNYNPNNSIAVTVTESDAVSASIVPVITSTSISSFNITQAGGFYNSPPAITISPPDIPATTAQASAVITGDVIDSISITNSGVFYNQASVNISPPPNKSAQIKFGDDALAHSNHTDVTLSHITDYNLITAGSGFSIEFWIYPTEFHPNDSHILNYSGQTMRIEIEASGELVYRPAANAIPVRSTPEVLILNQWNHCRIEHVGATAKWLVNGIADAGGAAPQGFLFGGGATVNIGSRSANERSFLGSLDNLTFSVETTLTPTGTYTVPTSALVGTQHTDDFDRVLPLANATVTNGEVTSINVTNPGANYANTVPTITISDPDDVASNYQASATAVLTDGAVTAITINNTGKFYNIANVSIEEVVANNATATAQISQLGEISGITVTNAGLGYRTAPTITIEGPAATSVAYTQIEFDDDWGIITLIEDA